MTNESPSYHGYRFPPEIIGHAVWLYHRFSLSFRDTEDLLAQRGVTLDEDGDVSGIPLPPRRHGRPGRPAKATPSETTPAEVGQDETR